MSIFITTRKCARQTMMQHLRLSKFLRRKTQTIHTEEEEERKMKHARSNNTIELTLYVVLVPIDDHLRERLFNNDMT